MSFIRPSVKIIAKPRHRTAKACLFVLLALMLSVGWLDPYRDRVDEGNAHYRDGQYGKALDRYREAEKYAPGGKGRHRLGFNRGDARYMQRDYDGAVDEFREALKSDDPDVQKRAFFNMGNAYLKKGDTQSAVSSYINALRIDPGYEAAKKNIEYILQKKQDKSSDGRKDGSDGSGEKDGRSDQKQRPKDGREQGDRDGEGQRRGAKGSMSREQMKSILDSLKSKPVRRYRGGQDGGSGTEKPW